MSATPLANETAAHLYFLVDAFIAIEEAIRTMDRDQMAAAIRAMEPAAAAVTGMTLGEYRQWQVELASDKFGVNITEEEFVSVCIDGTADVVDGKVVPC